MGDIESRHFDKAFIRRFVLDIRKLHNFQELSELSNDECPRDVFIRTPWSNMQALHYLAYSDRGNYIHLGVGFASHRSTIPGNAKAS